MASPQKKLSIAFYWHMHQPVYQLSPEGDYVMPWVRLHSVKDYLDMANLVRKFQNIKLNFNMSPVLLNGFENYGEKGLHDLHSRFTVSDVEDFSTDDKNYILNNFFDANYQSMILKYPEYNRLYQKYQESGGEDVKIFNNQEYSDLMALFNLAWMDPLYKNEYPELKKLYKKGKNYTKEDRIKIIEIQRRIIRRIVPEYKELIEQGKIEVTTSPFYHPILPILLDIKDTVSGESDDLPSNLKTELDAKIQTQFALDRIEQTFGKRPRGIWPSEHCVSEKELNMFKELGVEWTISDEGILSDSINFEFVRDFKGYLEDPYHLLKSYRFKTKYSNIDIIFRDAVIPNLISFEYPNHDSVGAANDLYDRIKVTQSKLLSSPDENHLLTIAMDGENCWENYLDDGNEFLTTLYNLIDNDPTLETVLISDYLDREKHPKPLNKICAGSWINKTFKLWIDEPIKNLAWTYLKQVRDDFCRYVRKNPLNPNIKIYGVQSSGAPSMVQSLEHHKIETLSSVSTIADGIAVKEPGEHTYKLCEKYVDGMVSVTDDQVSAAILALIEKQKMIAEGAGAVSLAAVMFGKIPDLKGKKVVCLISGGNIDVTILSRVINRGLLMSGRTTTMTIELVDKPGQLVAVSAIIAGCGGNVTAVLHERSSEGSDVNGCYLRLTIETRDFAHIKEIEDKLTSSGFKLVKS